MPQIKHDAIGDVDVSGATFTQQSHEVAETFAPDVLEFLGKTGLDQFKRSRLRDAEDESKNLLEQLTGEKRSVQLAKDQADLFAVEEDLALEFSSSEPGSEAHELTRGQLLGLQEQKEMLALHQEALIQGLLTEEEYRKKAEMSFYTQVALTPGIKEELAAVMGEHFGFDPRGQTAQTTLDARKRLKGQQDRVRNKQLDMITAHGYPTVGMGDQEIINTFWPLVQKRVQGANAITDLEQQLAAQESINDAEMAGVKKNARAWISDALPMALTQMGNFKGRSAYSLSVEEIRGMDDQTRIDWLDTIDQTGQEFTTPVARLSLQTGDDYKEATTAMTNRQEILRAIVSGSGSDEILAARLKRAQNEFNIQLEAEKARLVMDQRGILTLAALGDVIDIGSMLETQAANLPFLVNAMSGGTSNLKELEDDREAGVKNMFIQSTSQGAAAFEADPKGLNDAQIDTIGRAGNMIANHDVDQIGLKERAHLFKLAGTEGFMARLEKTSPEEAQKMKRGVIKHQAAHGVNWNREMREVLSGQPVQLTPTDFYIKKADGEEGHWLVALTENRKDRIIQETLLAGEGLGGPKVDQSTKQRFAQERADAIEQRLMEAFNTNAGMFNNLIKSRAAAGSISLGLATGAVARDLGISPKDVLKNTEKPGFLEEETGKKLDEVSSLDTTAQAILQISAQTGASFDEIKEFIIEQNKTGVA